MDNKRKLSLPDLPERLTSRADGLGDPARLSPPAQALSGPASDQLYAANQGTEQSPAPGAGNPVNAKSKGLLKYSEGLVAASALSPRDADAQQRLAGLKRRSSAGGAPNRYNEADHAKLPNRGRMLPGSPPLEQKAPVPRLAKKVSRKESMAKGAPDSGVVSCQFSKNPTMEAAIWSRIVIDMMISKMSHSSYLYSLQVSF